MQGTCNGFPELEDEATEDEALEDDALDDEALEDTLLEALAELEDALDEEADALEETLLDALEAELVLAPVDETEADETELDDAVLPTADDDASVEDDDEEVFVLDGTVDPRVPPAPPLLVLDLLEQPVGA